MDNSLVTWMPGLLNMGGAVVVTFLFLIYLYKRGDKSEQSAEKVTEQITILQQGFFEHNHTLTSTFTTQIETYNHQFSEVMKQNFIAIGETIRAIGALQTAVSSLQTAVSSLQSTVAANTVISEAKTKKVA